MQIKFLNHLTAADWIPHHDGVSSSTASELGSTHLIVTSKTEKITILLPRLRIQFHFAVEAIEMIRMVNFTCRESEKGWSLIGQ